jgi:hypothetical protein
MSKQNAVATCKKCGALQKGAAGHSHVSCGGIFVIKKKVLEERVWKQK